MRSQIIKLFSILILMGCFLLAFNFQFKLNSKQPYKLFPLSSAKDTNAPDPSKPTEVLKSAKATEVLKSAKATEVLKSAKATEVLKSAKATEVLKSVKATEVVKSPKPTKVVKSPKPTKVVKSPKPTKVVKSPKPTKVVKSPKPTKVVKSPKPTKVVKSPKPTKVVKSPKPVHDPLLLLSGSPHNASISHYHLKKSHDKMDSKCYDFGGDVGNLCGVPLATHLMFPPDFTKENVTSKVVKLLIRFDTFCRKHQIDFILDSGSLIGSTRHGQVLPWDDDSDGIMPLSHVHKLLLLKKELEDYGLAVARNEVYLKVFPVDGKGYNSDYLTWKWPFIDIFSLVPHGDKFEVLSIGGRVQEIPKNVVYPLRRIGRISTGPGEGHLFNVPNNPFSYNDMTAGKKWSIAMVGTEWNHREETYSNNANGLPVPYEIMQQYVPSLVAQVTFSTSSSGNNSVFGEHLLKGVGDMDEKVRRQKGGIKRASLYTMVGKSRNGQGSEYVEFHLARRNAPVTHVLMAGNKFPKGHHSKGEFIEEMLSGLMERLLTDCNLGIEKMSEGSGLVHYYGMKGKVCEKRISYGVFVKISRTPGNKKWGINEGWNWCELVVSSGICGEGKKQAEQQVVIETLHCMSE